MTAGDVLDVIKLFERNAIEVIIDGGWAVDALLGEQTRPHSDLDIAMPHKYVPLARHLLEGRGYCDVPRTDTRDCNFVMGDDSGRTVDFHTYTYDESGNLLFGLPAPIVARCRLIAGCQVRCITPEWLVKFHIGYSHDTDDVQDVLALCQRYTHPIPPQYTEHHSGKECEQISPMPG
jgi:lincosamide nucleotidyltransferase A/C/D/E